MYVYYMFVHYVSPEIISIYIANCQIQPSAPAAESEIKLPPPLHLAHGDPNGLRGNIRLLNSATRSPAVTNLL